nr:uncharacterized protein LOC109179035 [Ipomoea batatas]
MEFFQKAKKVRLRGRGDKHLIAADDEETVIQCRNGSAENAVWRVEVVEGKDVVRLKSCHGKYLTASCVPFIPGVTGKKVLQTVPDENEAASTEWEPIRDGFQVRLRTFQGNYLRPNRGLPPWRNSITHDPPNRNRTYEKALWDVEAVEEEEQAEKSGQEHRRTKSEDTFARTTTRNSRSIQAPASQEDRNSLDY